MATIKICDRCGAKIENKAWPFMLTGEDKEYKYEWDLCDSCIKKLKRFLESEETSED